MQTRQTVARTHEAPACFFAGALRVMRERVSKFTGNAAARKRTSSRVPLPPPRVGDETPNLFLQFANAASPGKRSPVTARLPVFSRTPLLFLYVGDETPNLTLRFINAASPNENPPATARLPVSSHALRPPLRASDETPNLLLTRPHILPRRCGRARSLRQREDIACAAFRGRSRSAVHGGKSPEIARREDFKIFL